MTDSVHRAASIIMAAGRGSRMVGYEGNKTLMPLVPENSPFEGRRPLLHQIFDNLPEGPKGLVVHFQKAAVIEATLGYSPEIIEQPVLNGTGGALIAARRFIETTPETAVIITMGDVPLVRSQTYQGLLGTLENHELAVLGFRPDDKRQYGLLEIKDAHVQRIVEWKDWHLFPREKQNELTICNAGIYAVKTTGLRKYLPRLASQPHRIEKTVDGKPVELQEYFITDLVEYMCKDQQPVGHVLCNDPRETTGVDDLDVLQEVQSLFRIMGSERF